jgi:hypothetical protein
MMGLLRLLFASVYLTDEALDQGLDYLNVNEDRMDICSSEPGNYTEATSTYTLGNKTSHSIGAPQAGDTTGRKVIVAAVSDGSVTGDGTASHYGLSYVGGTALLAANSLASSQGVSNGNTWTTPAFDIEFPDPT